jgi:aryl-alcohol dehydrogenase-like predicted oxidoreductase/predicted MFS family arabinose efflux permease
MASGTAALGGRGGLPRAVWVLAAGSFVNSSGSFVVSFLVLYLVHRGYGTGLAAWAVSAYAAGKMAAGPVGGLATDRLGPRAVTAASMAGSAAATLALAAASGPGPILATSALTGLVSQLYRSAASAILAADVPGQRRVQAFGVYQLGVSAGATAGPAIGGLVAEHSFLILFLADAATSLAWAIVAWRALPATRARSAENGLRPDGHVVLADRRLMRLLAVTVLVNLVLFQAQTTLPLWVHRQGLPTAAYGLLLALNSGLVVALQLPAARLAGRRRPEPVIAVASVVIGAGFTLLAVVHTAVLLAAAVTVWSLGELTQWPVAAAYTTRLAPPGMTGRYAGARSFCYGLALLLAPLAGTALYGLSPAALWPACGAAGICAAAVITPASAWPRPRGHALERSRHPGNLRATGTSMSMSMSRTGASPDSVAARLRPASSGPGVSLRPVEVNGGPGALYLGAQQRLIAVVVLDIAAGQITSISAIVNPDKLPHLGPVGDLTSLPGVGEMNSGAVATAPRVVNTFRQALEVIRWALRVSELFLGAMTFGEQGGVGAPPEECARILDTYAEAGGSVVDTAVNYRGGQSGEILGQLLQGQRDRFVLSTKYTVTRDRDDPNAAGHHRKNLRQSLETSLRRLRTDYIAIHWVHMWDAATHAEETLRALDDQVRAGKLLYAGISDAPAWVIARANTLAEWHGWTAFAGLQAPYSLLRRDIERELPPMAEALGLTVTAWSPLADGISFPAAYLGAFVDVFRARNSPRHSPSCQLTTLIVEIEAYAYGRRRWEGHRYPTGANSAWIPG